MKRTPIVIVVSGARPNFPKAAPLIRALNALPRGIRPRVCTVHTGQHYDYLLSQVFIEQLGMPQPDFFLGAGSGSHAIQTAAVIEAFERVLLKVRPALVVVVGDVNSTLACALAAAKLQVPVAHVEAGLRSCDRSMPEETNRIVTDHLSDLLFTHCAEAGENLVREGIARSKIVFAGNVMIDSLAANLGAARGRPLLKRLGLEQHGKVRPYALATLHRPSNVDDKQVLAGIVGALAEIAKKLPVLYPAHPRALASIERFGLRPVFVRIKNQKPVVGTNGLFLLDPLGYLDFIGVESRAACVFTDSGGVQEETSFLGVPCLTVRGNTERPVTISLGTNRLAGTSSATILRAWRAFRRSHELVPLRAAVQRRGRRIPKWDGNAAPRVAAAIARWLARPERT